MYKELKAKVIKIKQENPNYKTGRIYDMVCQEFDTNKKQISNILAHNKKAIFAPGGLAPNSKSSHDFDTQNLPPIPNEIPNETENEEFSIPLTLYSILYDDFLDNDKKVEILKIMFPNE